MALLLFALVLSYCLASAFSIALLGDKKLLSGNLYQAGGILSLVFNWKFIVSMTLAVLSRVMFVLINNTLLKIPYLAGSATTITVFVSLLSIILIVIVNHYVLGETLNLRQGIGAFIVMAGVFLMLSK